MNDHTHSPAAHLLGVQCIVCATPLSDAKSAELGIGPVCRKKWGYNDEIPGGEPARQRANALVYEATCAKRDGNVERVLEISNELQALGLVKLANRIRDRFVDLRLTPVQIDGVTWYDVFTPYRENFPHTLKRLVPADDLKRVHCTGKDEDGDPIFVRGAGHDRSIGGKFDHWCVHSRAARLALAALAVVFPGQRATGAQGVFQIPAVAVFRRVYVDEAVAKGTLSEAQAEYIRKRIPEAA